MRTITPEQAEKCPLFESWWDDTPGMACNCALTKEHLYLMKNNGNITEENFKWAIIMIETYGILDISLGNSRWCCLMLNLIDFKYDNIYDME